MPAEDARLSVLRTPGVLRFIGIKEAAEAYPRRADGEHPTRFPGRR